MATVKIDNYRGKIRLRWSVDKQRYSLGLRLDYSPVNLKMGEAKARQIEIDVLAGNFDPSLDKYRIDPVRQSPIKEKPTPSIKISLLDLWDDWVSTLDLPLRTKVRDYDRVRAWINRESVTLENITQKFKDLANQVSAETYNKNLRYCNNCFRWAIDSGGLALTPIATVKRRKQPKTVSDNRKPYNPDELKLIFDAFKTDRFCPPKSRYPHSHWLGFLIFIALTGVRVSEAIGIRVKDVNLRENTIEISTVLARSDTGLSSGKQRVRKECKTGNLRTIGMSEQLRAIVIAAMSGKANDDLLFVTHRGNPIDDNNWRERVFKKIVLACGLQYRCVHALRHSAASRWLSELSITEVSALLGHADPSITLRVYSHVLNKPVVPNL